MVIIALLFPVLITQAGHRGKKGNHEPVIEAIVRAKQYYNKRIGTERTTNELKVEATGEGWCVTFYTTNAGSDGMIYAKDGSKIYGGSRKICLNFSYDVILDEGDPGYQCSTRSVGDMFSENEGMEIYNATLQALEAPEVKAYLEPCAAIFMRTVGEIYYKPVMLCWQTQQRQDLWKVGVRFMKDENTGVWTSAGVSCGCDVMAPEWSIDRECVFYIYLRKSDLEWMAVSF
jgi:hypothetical protein